MIGVGAIFDTSKASRSLWIIVGFALTLPASRAPAQNLRTAELTPATAMLREADLPHLLSVSDATHYRHIFALQQSKQWEEADREAAQLGDQLLLGTVLGQRYRNSAYHANYGELVHWLERYADQPDAKTIYALALQRRPHGTIAPPKPVTSSVLDHHGDDESDIEPRPVDLLSKRDRSALAPAAVRRAAALGQEIRGLAPKEPHRAELMLAGPEAKQIIDPAVRDQLRAVIAEGYLALGDPQQALTMSATNETDAYAPVANWNAGLAAWRLGRLDEARTRFQAVARSAGQTAWTKSAAAFWSARVELRAHRPENYSYWLRIAAENARTFYGLLARRLLGIDHNLSFDADRFTEFDAQLVRGSEAGRRILALVAIDQRELAAAELSQLAAHGSPSLLQSLAALADRANLPAASLELAAMLANSDGRSHDLALYPVPRWEPLGGFTIDRALIFALMRQESQFLPKARNQSGATGLMQLMPATARSMAERTGVPLQSNRKAERAVLSDPETNLLLAQEYVELLLKDSHIKGNLILFAAAYNHGPTAVARWQDSRPEYRDDPLLFLESLPWVESRVFTQRVLTNYWIYRLRLNQPTMDLDALAAGHWPTYIAMDGKTVADNGRHAKN
jgi:soluble lytic murein transglycosylase-like protein